MACWRPFLNFKQKKKCCKSIKNLKCNSVSKLYEKKKIEMKWKQEKEIVKDSHTHLLNAYECNSSSNRKKNELQVQLPGLFLNFAETDDGCTYWSIKIEWLSHAMPKQPDTILSMQRDLWRRKWQKKNMRKC